MSHKVPAGAVVHEIPKIKGSRFIASVAPVWTQEDAHAHLDVARRAEHSARHHCWAFRLGADGAQTRSSDAGEPSGSAGKPILAAIIGADLTFVSVVVTRYFGGTKLGVGGLVRAYGGAAAEALEAVRVRVVVPTLAVRLTVDYDQMGIVETFCAREGLKADEAEYGAQVALRFDVPVADADSLCDRLFQASAGRIRAEVVRG